ncbi:Fic family protein [Pantoea sp.]|uniref:Fic family protein n=1 Tax=Pantoea sp. TaxID=69393 RepID=UPI0028B0CA58|nr:Fic family protein [Pantoea sp.]
MWIWQQPNWPAFHWQDEILLPLLRHLQQQRGVLLGRASIADNNDQQTLDTLLTNILSSSAIEDVRVNAQSVRSSLARRLGVSLDQPYPVSECSEGLAAMMMDAITLRDQPLTLARLCEWHRWLFPVNEWSTQRFNVGGLRGEEPMQVVSGRIDRPTVHFEAPPRAGLDSQLQQFIDWFNHSREDVLLDPLLRAGLCHLWFVTLHPFDDGNGRITRALTDLALAQSDSQSIRLYAMSASILARRSDYYRILQETQRGEMDVTAWLAWFLEVLNDSLEQALVVVTRTQQKARFWLNHQGAALSMEQTKVLNRLLDGDEQGFVDGISAGQYQKVAKVSKSTATRHLNELLEKGYLEKLPGGGRSTRYHIKH